MTGIDLTEPQHRDLGDQDTQEHRERINVRVGERWVIRVCELGGKSQRRRIRHAAGEDTGEREIVDFHEFPVFRVFMPTPLFSLKRRG